MAEKSNLHKLSELGQSIWIDFLSRDMLHSGELARMMKEDAVVGVTSNPTIFQKAISAGDVYDEQLRSSTRSFEAAHAAARKVIEQREQEAGKTDGYSNPQIAVGTEIKARLAELEARLAAVP